MEGAGSGSDATLISAENGTTSGQQQCDVPWYSDPEHEESEGDYDH